VPSALAGGVQEHGEAGDRASHVQLPREAVDGGMAVACGPALWVSDEERESCQSCRAAFGLFLRRHHCRRCGDVFCGFHHPWLLSVLSFASVELKIH
jgi:hypothetical protein